jgi:hypothetical protein
MTCRRPTSKPAKLAQLADSSGGFDSLGIKNNVSVRIFAQKDFICGR